MAHGGVCLSRLHHLLLLRLLHRLPAAERLALQGRYATRSCVTDSSQPAADILQSLPWVLGPGTAT